jgi:hypothetical protein
MKQFLPGLSFLFIAILSSCSLFDGKETQPAYISIDQFSVATDPTLQGSSSSKITDAWVYVDNNLLGAYELPCRIPVLKQGQSEILLGAGIKVNGISSLRSPYVFFKLYSENANLVPGETSFFNPQVSYFDSLSFPLLANFDDISGNKLESTSISDTNIFITTNPSKTFEGNGSQIVTLLRDSGYIEFQTVDAYDLPKQGTPVYAELNYKCTHILSVGIAAYYPLSNTRKQLVINLNPTDTWNKVYLNLTNQVSTEIGAANYRLFFFVEKLRGTGPAEILIDNLKIIHS